MCPGCKGLGFAGEDILTESFLGKMCMTILILSP